MTSALVSCPEPCAAADSHAKRLSMFGLALLIVDGVLLLVLSVGLILLLFPLLVLPSFAIAFAAVMGYTCFCGEY